MNFVSIQVRWIHIKLNYGKFYYFIQLIKILIIFSLLFIRLRFLIWFVSNSILQGRSLALNNNRDGSFAFESLFTHVINDEKLKKEYKNLKK